MKINKEFIKNLNPCIDRYKNYLEYYKKFNGSVKEFLELEHVSKDDKEWVIYHASIKNIEIIKEALKYPEFHYLASKNNYTIRWAVEHGQTEIVKLLLEARDDSDKFRVDPAVNHNYAGDNIGR